MATGKTLRTIMCGVVALISLEIGMQASTPLAAQDSKEIAVKKKKKIRKPKSQKTEKTRKEKSPPEKAESGFALDLPKLEDLLPVPEAAIPDAPPPHEGAMIALPLRVYPPDLISIEVLEALPGRPITGERLVRPDGTITLGFYGDIDVLGLTTEQIKEKVIVRMRRFISDEALGLIAEDPAGEPVPVTPEYQLPEVPTPGRGVPPEPGERVTDMPEPGTKGNQLRKGTGVSPDPNAPPMLRGKDEEDREVPRIKPPIESGNPYDQAEGARKGNARRVAAQLPMRYSQDEDEADSSRKSSGRGDRPNMTIRDDRTDAPKSRGKVDNRRKREATDPAQGERQPSKDSRRLEQPTSAADRRSKPSDYEQLKRELEIPPLHFNSEPGVKTLAIPPRESDRVFVDVASFNSQVYYALGDFVSPGRLPWTSHETVLDAVNFAGGFHPNGDPKTLRLVRPARGGKPARVYPIDFDAIRNRGDVTANLQIFPGDRLIVDRKNVVESTIKTNADSARLNTVLNNALVYAYVYRNLDRLGEAISDKSSESHTVKIGEHSFKIYMDDQQAKIDPARRKAALEAFRQLMHQTMKEGGPEERKVIEEVIRSLDH